MLSPVTFAVSSYWPAEILAKLWNRVKGEVRPPWNPTRN